VRKIGVTSVIPYLVPMFRRGDDGKIGESEPGSGKAGAGQHGSQAKVSFRPDRPKGCIRRLLSDFAI
jgi:hypothetical protein